MRILRQFRTGWSTTLELVRGLWAGPFWWLVPLIALLLPAALIFVVLQSVPIVAPFVYTVF